MKRSAMRVLALVLLAGCGGDPPSSSSEAGSETETSAETGDGDPGDGDPGDGDPGDGDGEPGDGDGDPGDGDGDSGDGDGDGDPGGPLDDVLTLDQIQVKGTHNSYHVEPTIPIHPSHEYSHPPLDVQREDHVVRSFELGLHRGQGDDLYVYRIAVVDDVTTCEGSAIGSCLATIKAWSDANPGHVPIMSWLEIKDETGGSPINDLLIVDQAILDVFPPNRVLTPDSVQGTHETLRAALETDGWPTLGEVRGKVMFMVLNGGHSSVEAYTYGHTSLLARMMFVGSSDFSLPYAAVSKINNPGDSKIAEAHAARIITASNTCGADQDEDDCFDELAAGLMSGSHALKDDFLTPGDGMTYFLDFPDGN